MTAYDAAFAAADRYARAVEAGPAAAEAAAREALTRCRDALGVLLERLSDLGYPGGGAERPSRLNAVPGLAAPLSPGAVAEVRAALPVEPPRVLELFWEIVGGIDLSDARDRAHVLFFAKRGLRPDTPESLVDPLVIEGPTEAWLERATDALAAVPEDEAELPLAPDAFAKDNLASDGPLTLAMNDDWTPLLEGEFAWAGRLRPRLAPASPDLLTYLRASVLECGGFPGLFGTTAFEDLRRLLTAGLPPF